MLSRRSRHVLLAVLVTFSLAAAGCSSGGGDSDNASDNGSDDIELPNGVDSGSGDGSGGSDFFGSGECQQLAEAMNNSSNSGTDNIQDTADFLHEAADQAPADVADDLEVMADVYDQIADDPTQIGAAFITGDFIEATTNLSVWITENCVGIDIDG